jgi:hypothetical protein
VVSFEWSSDLLSLRPKNKVQFCLKGL